MTDYLFRYIFPAGYAVLPDKMRDPRASALLLAIHLQESPEGNRRQIGGPARGQWQFEVSGVRGVMLHTASQWPLHVAMESLKYPKTSNAPQLQAAIEHNDVLAMVFARLLLWTLPDALPEQNEDAQSWRQYLNAWRPGKPHPDTWVSNYAIAWHTVNHG